ncbi:MAG: class II aldolase/adducin family protein [Sedimentisphaerales bacterium]|nr:class II aldolase/adducin family protein [Sedimentisphaerales bacterium]
MKDIEAEFIVACHEVDRQGLAFCSSGNMSVRADNGTALLTATGSWFGRIGPESIAICQLETGKPLNSVRASVESRFHLGILRSNPEVNVVLHYQSPYATAIAAGHKLPDNFNVILEVPYYIGQPVMIDFLPPGSQQLADSVIEAAAKSSMVVIRNHGMVTYGKNFEEAIQRAVFFELACKVIAHQGDLSYITPEMIAQMTNA